MLLIVCRGYVLLSQSRLVDLATVFFRISDHYDQSSFRTSAYELVMQLNKLFYCPHCPSIIRTSVLNLTQNSISSSYVTVSDADIDVPEACSPLRHVTAVRQLAIGNNGAVTYTVIYS